MISLVSLRGNLAMLLPCMVTLLYWVQHSSMNGTSLLGIEAPPVEIILSLGQREIVVTIRLIMSFLSLGGSLFVIGSMIKYKKHYGPHRLIMILTLCYLGEAVTNLLSFGTFSHEADRPGTTDLKTLHICSTFKPDLSNFC